MKLTLYMAISVDGLITKGKNDSDWVSKTDWEQFFLYIQKSDVVIMGKHTMEQFPEGEFPIEGPVNIVLTHNKNLHKNENKLVITEATAENVILLAKQKGWNNLLLIGGANVNSQFARAGLINEIVLSVHPLAIGKGLSLFGRSTINLQLKLLASKDINNELVQLRYKVMD